MKCNDKLLFETRKEAKKYAKKHKRLHGHELDVYKCGACGFFHLTHIPKKKSRSFNGSLSTHRRIPHELTELREYVQKNMTKNLKTNK